MEEEQEQVSDDGHDDDGGGLLGVFVSIKGCTLLLCITCIVVTAAICMVLAVRSADSALDEKDKQYNKALDSLTATTQESVESLTFAFVNTLVQGQWKQVNDQISIFRRLAASWLDEFQSFPARGINTLDWDQLYPAIKSRYWADTKQLLTAGLTGLGVLSSTGATLWMYESDDTLGNPPEGRHEIWTTVQRVPRVQNVGEAIPYDGGLHFGYPCCRRCYQIPGYSGPVNATACLSRERSDTRESAAYMLPMLLPQFPPAEVRWVPLSTAGDVVGFGTVATWTAGPSSDSKRGVIVVGADLDSISTVYRQAVLTAPGAKMRIFSVVRREWVYQAVGPTLAALFNHEDQAGLLTGVSRGQSAYVWYKYDAGSGCNPCLRRWARTDVNASDHLIRSVAQVVNGSYELYNRNETREIQATVESGSPKELFFVRSIEVEDNLGLSWWLIVVVDRAYVLAKIEASLAATLDDIKEGNKQIDDDIEQDRFILYIAVAGAAVVLIMMSVVFVFQVNRPLRRLMIEMQHVSNMDVDAVDEQRVLSNLQEVQSMEVSFRKMIHNLREFRKYMPASILDDDGNDDDFGVSVRKGPPPPEGVVTLVFTDIKGSTSLWEQATEAMGISLKLHNKIMREAIAECNGYEVKTVGDAFFVVFQDAADACRFGIKAQYDLNFASWPQDLADCGLLQSARIEEAGKLHYAGVRVRIGIHTGPCELELNPMTGRADYFGPPVNVAARLEANGAAGFVGVSDEVVSAVGTEQLKEMCGAMVPLGVKELKGVGKPVTLTGLLPKGLEERAKYVTKDGAELFQQVQAAEGPEKQNKQKKLAVLERLKTALTAARGATVQMVAPLEWDESNGLAGVLDDANLHLSSAELAAERTEGLLQQAAGSLILITWNAGRRCANAQDQALEFVGMMFKRLHKEPRLPSLGVACGVVLHGNLGRGARRFATVLGGCVELSASLAVLARSLSTFALCTGLEATAQTKGRLRPYERWEVRGWSDYVNVFEIDSAALAGISLQESSNSMDLSGLKFVDQGWREAYEENHQDYFMRRSGQEPTSQLLASMAHRPQPSAPQLAWWICGVDVPESALARRGSSVGSHISVQTTGGRRRRASGARKAQPDEKKGDAYQQQQAG